MSAPTSSPDSVLATPSEPALTSNNDVDGLPALETKQESDEIKAKKPYVPSEEEKRTLFEKAYEHSRRLNLVSNVTHNAACGVLPTLMSMNRKWNLLFPEIPKYKQHLVCPFNPEHADMNFLIIDEEGNVHAIPGKFCCCETKLAPHLTPTQQDAYNQIVLMATAPVSSALCMPIVALSASNMIYSITQAIAERAIFLEHTNQPSATLPLSKIPSIIKDIEVYVVDESKIEFVFDLLYEQFKRNDRNIRSSHNKKKLYFKHTNSVCEIQIDILPHKAIRKGWHPFLADNVYIIDSLVHDDNTPNVRHSIALNAFGARAENTPIRRMVIEGSASTKEALIEGASNLHALRKYAEDMQIELREGVQKRKMIAHQQATHQLVRLQAAKDAHQAANPPPSGDGTGDTKESKSNEDVESEGVEMTDLQYEARQQLRAIKEENQATADGSFYQAIDNSTLSAGVAVVG